MNKLSDYKTAFEDFSGRASGAARQLAFAGIALLWVFRIESADGISLSLPLWWAAGILIAALGFDLLQYVYGAVCWGIFFCFHEKRLKGNRKNPALDAPVWLNYVTNTFFLSKIGCVVLAYAVLLYYVMSRVGIV